MPDNRDELSLRAAELHARSIALTEWAIQLRVRAGRAIGRTEELQRTVTAYAETLRRMGEPPERAIDRIRLVADEAMRQASPPEGERETVMNQLVLWAVDAYAA